jgi:uncharacterized protein (DUF1810 family)
MQQFDHFLAAQQPVLATVEAELAAGHKTTHWMWFVFPQLAGLGVSPMARRFALESGAAAAAYVAHPVLGPRLVRCTQLVNAVAGRTAHEIFGAPDDLKFHASMTLFARAAPEAAAFTAALARFFAGREHVPTLNLLGVTDGR